jgi:hypothetical protein
MFKFITLPTIPLFEALKKPEQQSPVSSIDEGKYLKEERTRRERFQAGIDKSKLKAKHHNTRVKELMSEHNVDKETAKHMVYMETLKENNIIIWMMLQQDWRKNIADVYLDVEHTKEREYIIVEPVDNDTRYILHSKLDFDYIGGVFN